LSVAVRASLSNGSSDAPDVLRCAATVAAAKVATIIRLGARSATCSLIVPKTASGKSLAVKVTGTWNAASLAKTLAFRVQKRATR
jgi:hypothetical protein